jgi:hypothetical protein
MLSEPCLDRVVDRANLIIWTRVEYLDGGTGRQFDCLDISAASHRCRERKDRLDIDALGIDGMVAGERWAGYLAPYRAHIRAKFGEGFAKEACEICHGQGSPNGDTMSGGERGFL